jgi:hypothetical protein
MCRHRRSLQRHAVRQKVTLAFLLALKDQIFSPCSHTRKKKTTQTYNTSLTALLFDKSKTRQTPLLTTSNQAQTCLPHVLYFLKLKVVQQC